MPAIDTIDDCAVDIDIENIPPRANDFPVTPVVPSISSVLKTPEQLSSSGLWKRVQLQQDVVKDTLGSEWRVTKSPEKRVSLHDAAAFRIQSGLTEAQYACLDRRVYPSLNTVKQYENQLVEEHKKLTSMGFAEHVLHNFNLLDSFSFETVRVNIGGDKGKRPVLVLKSFVATFDFRIGYDQNRILFC